MIDDHEEFTSGVRITRLDDLVHYLTRNADKPFRILYSSPTLLDEPWEDGSEFNRLCKFVYNIPDFAFFINEVALYTESTKIPEEFKKLITQGRRQFIDIICTVRRKVETHRILTSQADILASFKQVEPDDVRYCRSRIGELADEIPNLEMLEFVYTTGREVGRDKIKIRGSKIEAPNNFLKKLDLNGGYQLPSRS